MSKCSFWIHELEGGALALAIRENLEIIVPKFQNVQYVCIFPNNLTFF